MDKQSILYGVIGIFLGGIIAILASSYAVNSNNANMMNMMGMNNSQMMGGANHSSMNDMMNVLQNKTGDEFDELFISQMIEHHQGAIDMANQAKQSAKHDEIKQLAEDIISAQEKEINQMKMWQKEWGYTARDDAGTSSATSHMMAH